MAATHSRAWKFLRPGAIGAHSGKLFAAGATCLRARTLTTAANDAMTDMLTVTDSTFVEVVERNPGLTLVELWASWCLPCILLAPVVERLWTVYADRVRMTTLNADEGRLTMDRFGVRAIPTLLLFENGHAVASLIGSVPQARVEALLDAHLSPRAA